MRPVEFYKSSSARLAFVFTGMVLTGVLLGGLVAYLVIKTELEQRHYSVLDNDIRFFQDLYESGGTDEVIGSVKAHLQATRDRDAIFYLVDKSGDALVSNVSPASRLPDRGELRSSLLGFDEDYTYFVRSSTIGEWRLTIGHSAEDISEIQEVFLLAGGWAILLLLALTISGAFAIATRTNQRISTLALALDAINNGELKTRLPVSSQRDDIDRLVTLMNRSIASLGALVETNRQITTDIAHDLKTPLSRMRIEIETAIERENRGESVADDLARIEAESNRILNTFNSLMRISQIEAGARRERFVEMDLVATVTKVAEFYESYAEDLGARLMMSTAERPMMVHGDPELISQLVSNLLENAFKHAGERPEIAVRVLEAPGKVLLQIKDNGPGIPESERNKVLRRLYRLEQSRSTPGAGLGLALVKAVADLHGAEIELDDNGPGLIVSVAFPSLPG